MASDAVEAEFAAALAVAAANQASAIASANIAATSRVTAATIEATATVQAEATRYAAQVQSAATTAAAHVHASAAISAANIQSSATISAANIQGTATTSAAEIHAAATTAAATTQASATRDAANAQKEATITSANTRAQADVQVEGIRSGATRFSAELGLQGNVYSSDKQLLGVDHREAGETNRLKIKLAWADGKWNEVFPFVQSVIEGQLSGGDDGGTAARWLTLEGLLGMPPPVYVSEVWTPQDIQYQLNQVYNKTTATAQSRTRLAEIDLAGRGLSSDSPIMDVLRMGYEGYALMAATQAETDIALNTSKENTEAILKSQVAATEAWARLAGSYTELEKNAVQLSVGTLQAIASMVGGIL